MWYCLRQDSLCLGQTTVWPAAVCLIYWGGVCTWSTVELGSIDDQRLETVGQLLTEGGLARGGGRHLSVSLCWVGTWLTGLQYTWPSRKKRGTLLSG